MRYYLNFRHAGVIAPDPISGGAFISQPPGIRGESEEMNNNELYEKIIIVLSDGAYEKRQNEEKFKNLYSELSQLPTDSSVRTALIDVCDALENLSDEFDYYKQWI